MRPSIWQHCVCVREREEEDIGPFTHYTTHLLAQAQGYIKVLILEISLDSLVGFEAVGKGWVGNAHVLQGDSGKSPIARFSDATPTPVSPSSLGWKSRNSIFKQTPPLSLLFLDFFLTLLEKKMFFFSSRVVKSKP